MKFRSDVAYLTHEAEKLLSETQHHASQKQRLEEQLLAIHEEY